MRLLMIGMNHRTAPIELREQVAIAPEAYGKVLGPLVDSREGAEAIMVSTCNRTEIYVAKPSHAPPFEQDLRRHLAQLGGLSEAQLDQHVICLEQDDATAHLIGVAAGLDSLALGEPHILGQVRRAYEAANEANRVGYVLHTVMQQALAGAKQVRRDWATLLDGQVSIATLAIDFARQVFETFEDKTVLGIGAGEIGKMTMRTLMRHHPRRLLLVNRTAGRADQLAHELGLEDERGGAWPWDQLDQALVQADVLVSATGSAQPIVTVERLKPVMKKRRNRPLFIFDAALPRDVADKVGSLRNVYLYNLDDLETSVASSNDTEDAGLGPRQRRIELDRAWSQVRGIATATMSQVQHRDVGRLIRELRTRLQSLGQAEQTRTQRKLQALVDPSDPNAVSDALDEHTHRLINKILHMPLKHLDQSNPQAPLGFYAAALRELFDLETESHRPHEPNHGATPCEANQNQAAQGRTPSSPTLAESDEPEDASPPFKTSHTSCQSAASKATTKPPAWCAILLVGALIWTSACTAPTLPRWQFVSAPSAKVTDMRVTDQTDEGAALVATVVMKNPNDFGLPLKNATYRMSVGDQTVHLQSHPPYALPPRGQQLLTLNGALPTAGVDLHGKPYRLTGSVIYDAPGELRKVIQDFGVPQPRISFQGRGQLSNVP